MLQLMSEVKFLTSRDDINLKDTDFGAFKYAEKKSQLPTNQPYIDGKQEYASQRNHQYMLHGRKTKQLRNSIRKLEEFLKFNRIVYCSWRDNYVIQMLLSNGLLVHLCINVFSGDIVRMAFDRFFIGKLVSESVTDVIMTRMHIIISYDVNQLTFVYFQKPNLKKSAPEKISKLDPKIFNIIISGSPSKKISRHLACNNCYDLLAVWTKSSQNEVYPWRPTVRDQDRANIHIYRLSQNKLDLLTYYWTENDPLSVEFSKINQNQLRSIEQRMSRKGEVTMEICVYDVNKTKIQRISVTSIPLQSQVCCHSFSPDNEKLMLGCIDGAIILFDEGRGITHLIKAAFIPTLVSWHADSAIVMIANEKFQMQFFDISLSCVKSSISNEELLPASVLDLSNYFTTQPILMHTSCSKKPDLTQYNEKYIQSDSFVLCLFENGPLTLLRIFGANGHKGDFHTSGLTADVLIHQYLKLNNVEKAINVLLCLNWDVYGAMLMNSLHKIANYIFKQPFQPEREIQLQKALGSFLVPVKPLYEETQLEFGDQVKDITRKFFQYLLRNRSYEKAFNLAIDIDDEDLFMDLSNCAKESGLLDLAQDAFCKADTIMARSGSRQSSHSTCSRESCSECGSSADDESESGKLTKNKPKSRKAKLPENIINIPKPELRVSHFSKKPTNNIVQTNRNDQSGHIMNLSTTHRTSISQSKIDIDFGLQSPTNSSFIDRSNHEISRSNLRSQMIPQHHHVVEIVPKPQTKSYSMDWNVPAQTIGIPIMNAEPSSSQLSQRKNLTPNKSWSMQNISGTMPLIIHHPLVSGHIPPSFHSTENRVKKTKNLTTRPNILSTPNHESAIPQKKENGEKNKVKFSNTVMVAVAVVPDIPRKEKGLLERRNNFPMVQTMYHINDDFSAVRNDASPSNQSSNPKGGVLTWV